MDTRAFQISLSAHAGVFQRFSLPFYSTFGIFKKVERFFILSETCRKNEIVEDYKSLSLLSFNCVLKKNPEIPLRDKFRGIAYLFYERETLLFKKNSYFHNLGKNVR